jgi:hypothetical protein
MKKDELFVRGDRTSIWQKYCGFLDLSLQEFMQIQEDLLLDEIELVADTPLGRKLMNNRKPASVAEFRGTVPLTTYDDYAPYFDQRTSEALAEEPSFWVHTSGRSGSFVWVPYTQRAHHRAVENIVSAFILACATGKGEVNIKGNESILYNTPPMPYFSGLVAHTLPKLYDFRPVLPPELGDQMDFQERIEEGFRLALRNGIDILGSLTSVLMKIGEGFTEGARGTRLSSYMLHPGVLTRLARGWFRSKLERRNLLPKDIWQVKAIICGGIDTAIYKNKIFYYWGKEPYELYAATEGGFMALQAWNKKGMTFIPFTGFFEFIPETEWLRNKQDSNYQPATVLMDEVEAGKLYEIVITNFYGMPLLRYRLADMIEITFLKDEETGVNLPQMIFESRCDDLINIAGFTRLDEKTFLQAMADCNIKYAGWTIRKEYCEEKPVLRLYIELKEEITPDEIRHVLNERLKTISSDYYDLVEMLGIEPLRVTALTKGTFRRYYEEQEAGGSTLANLRPPRVNAPDSAIETILRLSR